MKKFNIFILTIMVMALSSCSAIAGIFKAGAITGIVAVFVVVGLIIWLFSSLRGRN